MALHGKRQAALVNELGWSKNKANKIWHGEQTYKRELVNELAAWLGIEHYELLMPPGQALALRRLKETAKVIAAGVVGQDNETGPPPIKTGTK